MLQKAEGEEEPNNTDNQHVLEKDIKETEKCGLISMRLEKSITNRG